MFDVFKGEMISLLKLVEKYSIVIPVIQRDYAQGRETERITEIREKFVKNLVDYAVSTNGIGHDLDFIYGDVHAVPDDGGEKEEKFIPLDGQQRLTTLFLFHMYIAGKSGHFDVFRNKFKGRFSYQTRNSAKIFCEKIIDNDVFERETENEISKVIMNQCWFFKSWLLDPSVAGMLVMLDAIEKEFKSNDDKTIVQLAYDHLFSDNKDPITFWLLPLNGYTRSDDLYIKMNARGVRLTDVEVFKAKFEDFLRYSKNENYSIFKRKIDCEWTDFFWPRKANWNCVDNVDPIIENLLRLTIGLSYRSSSTKDRIKEVYNNLFGSMRFTFSQFCELVDVFHFSNNSPTAERLENEKFIVQNIVDFFDFLCDINISPLVNNSCVCDTKWFDVKTVLDEAIVDYNKLDYSKRICLYAYLRYCSIHKGNIIYDDLNNWMLFIRNLDKSTRTDEMDLLNNALVSIDFLLKDIGECSVIEWLANQNDSYNLKHFRKSQFIEECIKSQIFLLEHSNPSEYKGMGALIDSCNSHDYLHGQIGFILLFSGWSDKFKENCIPTLDKMMYGKLKDDAQKYVDVIIAILDGENDIETDCLVERALLASESELCLKIDGDRLNFYNQRNHRDYSLRNLLAVDSNFGLTSILQTMKHFFDNLDSVDIVKSLNEKISLVNQSSWRYLLCKDSTLINYCTQGFICARPVDLSKLEPNVFLLAQSQMNHHHSELYSRDLYERSKNLFIGLEYMTVKSRGDYPGLYFDFKKLDFHYRCLIIHKDEMWRAHIYEIHQNAVPRDVQDLLSVINDTMNGDTVLKSLYDNISKQNDCSIVQ